MTRLAAHISSRATAVCAALAVMPAPAMADPQADALNTALDACLSISLSFEKRPRALQGFTDIPTEDSHLTQHAWGNSLSFPAAEPPYPLGGPALLALLPSYRENAAFYAQETRWFEDNGFFHMLDHPSGWTIAVEGDEYDPSSAYCTLWHNDLTAEGRAELDRITGYFGTYPLPFANVTEIISWRTHGTFDYDLGITIIYPNQELIPETAEVYVLTNIFAYDLTADY